MVYEVCVKCLEERRTLRGVYGGDRRLDASDGYGYEPTPVRGGDLGSVEARTYEVRLGTPRGDGLVNSNTRNGCGSGSSRAGVGGASWV